MKKLYDEFGFGRNQPAKLVRQVHEQQRLSHRKGAGGRPLRITAAVEAEMIGAQ